MSDDPVITDAEVEAFASRLMYFNDDPLPSSVKDALSAFLKARVPEHMFIANSPIHLNRSGRLEWCLGHNDCRDAVLRGKG